MRKNGNLDKCVSTVQHFPRFDPWNTNFMGCLIGIRIKGNFSMAWKFRKWWLNQRFLCSRISQRLSYANVHYKPPIELWRMSLKCSQKMLFLHSISWDQCSTEHTGKCCYVKTSLGSTYPKGFLPFICSSFPRPRA